MSEQEQAAESGKGSVQIERVNDGILCTFGSGATLWFDSRHDAGLFAANLSMICAFGGDTLDGAEIRDYRTTAAPDQAASDEGKS